MQSLVTFRTELGASLLHLAVLKGNTKAATKLIVKCHQLVLACDRDSRTPLHYSCDIGSVQLTNLLLNSCKGRELSELVTKKNSFGRTCLHEAIFANHNNVAKLACGEGLQIHYILDVKDNNGNTALHLAAQRLNMEGFVMLLNKGCNEYEKDNEGKTVRHTLEGMGKPALPLLQVLNKHIAEMQKEKRTKIYEAELAKWSSNSDTKGECIAAFVGKSKKFTVSSALETDEVAEKCVEKVRDGSFSLYADRLFSRKIDGLFVYPHGPLYEALVCCNLVGVYCSIADVEDQLSLYESTLAANGVVSDLYFLAVSRWANMVGKPWLCSALLDVFSTNSKRAQTWMTEDEVHAVKNPTVLSNLEGDLSIGFVAPITDQIQGKIWLANGRGMGCCGFCWKAF